MFIPLPDVSSDKLARMFSPRVIFFSSKMNRYGFGKHSFYQATASNKDDALMITFHGGIRCGQRGISAIIYMLNAINECLI